MNYKELVRLATEPGPMQELALQALAEEFAADERVDNTHGRGEQFDIARFAPEYIDARLAQPRVPLGDYSDYDEEQAVKEDAVRELMDMYDRQYPESLGDRAKGALSTAGGALSKFGNYITSMEGLRDTAQMGADSFLPVYSQLDSMKYADENMDRFVNHDKYGLDPLSAIPFLAPAAVGYIGSIPGVSSIVAGGRKLGAGARTLYEGLF